MSSPSITRRSPSWTDRVFSSLHWTQEHQHRLKFSLVGEDSYGQVAAAEAGEQRGIGVSPGKVGAMGDVSLAGF